jgi:hypothetical protein
MLVYDLGRTVAPFGTQPSRIETFKKLTNRHDPEGGRLPLWARVGVVKGGGAFAAVIEQYR